MVTPTDTAQLQAAMAAMEENDLERAISLLLHMLPTVGASVSDAHFETMVRILLSQALHKNDALQPAHKQAQMALAAAERTNNRELIWKSMALLTSIEIMENEDL